MGRGTFEHDDHIQNNSIHIDQLPTLISRLIA
jgi:hypothetical protein